MVILMLPSGCFTESNRLKALVFSRTWGTLKGDGTDIPHSLSTDPKFPTQIEEIKEVLADVLEIPASSIGTVLYTRKNGDGEDETTAMGKILVTFNPDVFNNPENPAAGYEVWARAVLQYGVATVNDSDVNLPIMSDVWFCEDLADTSICFPYRMLNHAPYLQ